MEIPIFLRTLRVQSIMWLNLRILIDLSQPTPDQFPTHILVGVVDVMPTDVDVVVVVVVVVLDAEVDVEVEVLVEDFQDEVLDNEI